MLQQYSKYLNVCVTVTELCFQMLVWSTNAVYEVKECKLLTVAGIVLYREALFYWGPTVRFHYDYFFVNNFYTLLT